VKVLFDGDPLVGQHIAAYSRDAQGSVSKTTVYTDSKGIGRVKLSKAGLWLLRLVHLIPCTKDPSPSCAGTDWKSYWTSYTFELD